MKLIKEKVCVDCQSLGISDIDCVCTYQNNYPTILLEFEQCECCNNIKEYPADTEFNKKQYEEYSKKKI